MVGDHGHLGPQPAEDLGRGAVRGAVGAVEQHPGAAQVELREARVELSQIVLQRAVQSGDASDSRRRGDRLRERLLDLVLGVVVELEPVVREQLDPVVLERVVGGRDDGRHLQLVAANQQWRGGRRKHAADQRVAAGGRDPRRDGRLEHLARFARVADDQDLWPRVLRPDDRCPGERQRKLGGQKLPGAATDTVRAEKLARHAATVSAWRTAGACVPSSGPPSCAP